MSLAPMTLAPMTLLSIPAFWMLAGALLVAVLPGKWLRWPLLLAPLLSLIFIWLPVASESGSVAWLGFELKFFESSALRQLFATVFALMAAAGGLYAMAHSSRRELAAAMAYAGSALGVCFAGDLLTLFIFWELMAIFSTLVIWCADTPQARAAGLRYAILHFLGGVLLMAGIAALAVQGSLAIEALDLHNPAAWLVLAGVLINAGAPPFGAWVADAYPEASAGGAVMLSAFTTKTSVLALILLFPGAAVLTIIGPLMVLYGMGYAMLTHDIRRLLAYSIVGQVGFMVTAVGVGSELALNAAAAHAFTHILYKGLLMMTAGAVLLQTGERYFTALGGLARTMPFTAFCAVIGGLTIAAVPLTSGYVSKSLISMAVDAGGPTWAAMTLSFASAAALVYVGLRFPWFVFFDRAATNTASEPPLNMRIAMGGLALACVLLGVAPVLLFALLPFAIDADPYRSSKLAGGALLLLIGAVVFWITRNAWRPQARAIRDTDWLYRVAGLGLVRAVESLWSGLRAGIAPLLQPDSKYARLLRQPFVSGGWLSRSVTVGTMISILVALLLIVLLV